MDGQPALGIARVEIARGDNCQLLGSDQVVCPSDYFKDFEENDENEEGVKEEEEEEPMLKKMPGLDFKAYVRQDISSMYQEPPGSRTEQTPAFTGQAGKFVNMSPERLDLYW